jgi:hypothetical protein
MKSAKVVDTFRHKGRVCVIKQVDFGIPASIGIGKHYCAYAETTLVGMGYSELGDLSPESLISCHGGLTFAGELEGHGKNWFFGMDFAHAGDEDRGWTVKSVKSETIKLCEEVIRYETDPELHVLHTARNRLAQRIEQYRRRRSGLAHQNGGNDEGSSQSGLKSRRPAAKR